MTPPELVTPIMYTGATICLLGVALESNIEKILALFPKAPKAPPKNKAE